MKIDFEFTTQYGIFRDALYLSDNHNLSEVEINELKQSRLDSWLYAVTNPPEPESELVDINGILYEKIEIGGQIVLKPMEG